MYLDDILITAKTESEHIKNLEEVLIRLEKVGLRLKKQKCSFKLPSVDYLGHSITPEGLQPTKEKIRAITDAPVPTNLAQLRSFLGLVNYYITLSKLAHHGCATLFLECIYKLIRSLLSPQEPKDVSFADIVKQMTDHYQPKPSIIMQHFKFHSRSCKQGEAVAKYIAELKLLAEDCEFGKFLEQMLRDRIVCGINDPEFNAVY